MPAFTGDMDIIAFAGRFLLATVFVVSAVAKFSNRKETRQTLIDFQLPVRFAAPTAYALPLPNSSSPSHLFQRFPVGGGPSQRSCF